MEISFATAPKIPNRSRRGKYSQMLKMVGELLPEGDMGVKISDISAEEVELHRAAIYGSAGKKVRDSHAKNGLKPYTVSGKEDGKLFLWIGVRLINQSGGC